MTTTALPMKAKVTRHFDAPAERVFDAWLDPDVARHWLFATPGEVVKMETDPRVGGAYTIVRRHDGQDFKGVGEYIEIDRPNRLVFTFCMPAMSPESHLITVDIQPKDEGCELTIVQAMQAEAAEYVGPIEAGWNEILDELTNVLR